jgi:glycosyltransferase 2 family protein
MAQTAAADAGPGGAGRRLRVGARIAAGLAVLALVVWYSDPGALMRKISTADPLVFALAVASAIAGNLASSARWTAIARALGLRAPYRRLVLMYARGITTNILLPGAMLSGDLLRSYQLSALGNPLVRSAASVFFDRFSGLWTLCLMSLLSAIGLAAAAIAHGAALPHELALYTLALAALVASPLLPWPTGWLRRLGTKMLERVANGLQALRERLRAARPAVLRSIWISLVVQGLSACTLWICGLAVGLDMSYWLMLAAAAPIFIAASLPLGVNGFGTRELGAVLVLGLLGVPAEQAAATALLYGMSAVVQGILAAPLFLLEP